MKRISDILNRDLPIGFTAQGVTYRFLRGLGIGGLAAIAFLGLADRVNATSVDLAGAHAGDYIDREWYYLLDDGQYRYLDRGQAKKWVWIWSPGLQSDSCVGVGKADNR